MGRRRRGRQPADPCRRWRRPCRRRHAARRSTVCPVPSDYRGAGGIPPRRGRGRGNLRQQEPGLDLEARRRPGGRAAGAGRARPAGRRVFSEHGQEIGGWRRPCREGAGADDGAAAVAGLRHCRGRCRRRARGGDLPCPPRRHRAAVERDTMIAKLTGILDSVAADSAIVDVGGVGYLAFCSTRTLGQLLPGAPARLLIETHVREDHIHLYGFIDAAELAWFRLLTTVQGVGARLALAILSAVPPEALTLAIFAQDKAVLAHAEGVGPKLAARIVNELRDKGGGLAIG